VSVARHARRGSVVRTRGPHHVSRHGLLFLIREEGVRLRPYNDARGLATVGVGHLLHMSPVTQADRQRFSRWTMNDALELLRRDLRDRYEPAVNRAVHVPLSQAEFDMLLSLAFNIGTGGLAGSRVVRLLNAGRRRLAAAAFLGWSFAGGRPILRPRRLRESARFSRARWR
jgi:lysozyme